jgi:hypothetical protein
VTFPRLCLVVIFCHLTVVPWQKKSDCKLTKWQNLRWKTLYTSSKKCFKLETFMNLEQKVFWFLEIMKIVYCWYFQLLRHMCVNKKFIQFFFLIRKRIQYTSRYDVVVEWKCSWINNTHEKINYELFNITIVECYLQQLIIICDFS